VIQDIDMTQQDQFDIPPMLTNADGKERTVGVEIEFGGVNAENAAHMVKTLFGGTLEKHNPNYYEVKGSSLGDFAVELDTRVIDYEEKGDGFLDEVKAELGSLFGAAASLVVPFEIGAPPVEIRQLTEIERLMARLREAGASGTEASLFFAFGLHLNPETPRRDARTVASIVKAYAMVGPMLWRAVDPDMTRRLLSFAEPFPDEYVRLVAGEDYWPDLATLIDDYLTWNPSRNRDLDLLPLFAFLDEDRVRRKLPNEKINPRPTFHYRLPNTELDDPEWGLAREWNRWVAVERLAADEERLAQLCRAYLGYQGGREDWAARIDDIEIA
jgi:putative amidoligase enzyme